MTTATDNLQPGQQTSSTAKPLWAAVGILGVAVLGMGGTMIYQGRTPAPVAQVAAVAPELNKPLSAASMARSSAGGPNAADDMIEKPSAAPAKPAPVPAKKVVKPKAKKKPVAKKKARPVKKTAKKEVAKAKTKTKKAPKKKADAGDVGTLEAPNESEPSLDFGDELAQIENK